jgi:hypothetical protein
MRVMKFTQDRKTRVVHLMRQGPVKFAAGDDWMLVKDLDRAWHETEMRWVHPTEVHVEWVREFRDK